MSELIVEGGHRLFGRVRISGAKNAALPLLAASLLTDEECIFYDVPNIGDVHTMLELLSSLGANVSFNVARREIRVCAKNLRSVNAPSHLVTKMRASFLAVGPLLGRFGRAQAAHPGGCAIGTRPVNVDIKGFEAMGSQIQAQDGIYSMASRGLKGAKIYLDYPSHTGTENLMMAACLARGTTVIKHASAEPEVICLAQCLRAMGAEIRGDGTSVIEIEGKDKLHGVTFAVAPDRIEAGTYAAAAAITGGRVTLENVDLAHMEPVTHKLTEIGVRVEESLNTYTVEGEPHEATEIQTLPYPGFPTDLQAAFAAMLTQAQGTSLIHERIYDNRLLYANELNKMGASIQVRGQTAIINGPSKLKGCRVQALDIRCGAALLLAGLVAEGETAIEDSDHIDRGYDDPLVKLSLLGAHIEKVDTGKVVA